MYMQQSSNDQVVAVKKNGGGDIIELKLSSGAVVNYKDRKWPRMGRSSM
jgi:hypothetical protein